MALMAVLLEVAVAEKFTGDATCAPEAGAPTSPCWMRRSLRSRLIRL